MSGAAAIAGERGPARYRVVGPGWTRALLTVAGFALAMLSCQARSSDLPTFGEVPRFEMTDQAGKPLTADALHGKAWAAAFVFTRCPTACPRVTRAMRGVQIDASKRGVPLRLVSFSIDPDNDTPEVLRRYAVAYGADLATWSFVTGSAAAVQKAAEQGFKIAVEGKADPSKPDFGITHGTQLVLIDGSGKIRGYYATSDPQPLTDLVTDAAKLANPPPR